MLWTVASMTKAPVNRLIPFSNVDGPGNRFALFLQGCPFSCLFCHNPETIHLCVHCGACVKTCPVGALSRVDEKVIWNREKCVNCDTCIKVCPHLSSPKIRMMSPQEVLSEFEPVASYVRGISVSGGECMLYPQFLSELFALIKAKGKTCLIDSNGFTAFENYPELMSLADGVMLDVKAVDDDFHKKICGVENKTVLHNFSWLLKNQKLEEVRTILYPNYEEENLRTVDFISKRVKNVRYKLLRYRPFGVRSQGIELLGNQTYSLEDAQKLVDLAKSNGASQVVCI
ncbi:MAG: YjjW family glycine radical enzyme activase [Erysipelotrichaceae bacterium]|nr:YjjW family glycine radical enzyme activase [Erysipelotrichaceae bacterium]